MACGPLRVACLSVSFFFFLFFPSKARTQAPSTLTTKMLSSEFWPVAQSLAFHKAVKHTLLGPNVNTEQPPSGRQFLLSCAAAYRI
ncbi:hypothetical protein BDP81DRAFT_424379 [Colletotrichum phormii]|uniref:Secreted protein n=1 Tax=Colletotrichum phormii TaxID=359342 RepID=A0AAI9ZUM1_9PEZI|nr:uncharacterized protein BDP81DRAFT_424379 [Colletotrichum phormii]KAK1638181.1 hypothetical protein BDP81DRAFT_424379 [Colletotrichum phormii]